jgi:hypothetical protein
MVAVPSATDKNIGDLTGSPNSMQATASPNHPQLLNPNSSDYFEGIQKVDSFITDALDIFSKSGNSSHITQRQATQNTSDQPAANGSSGDTVLEASVNTSQSNEEDEEDDDPHAVTWKLKLSPSMMILDTNIMTVAGLEKVLEQLKINVQPQSQFETSRSLVDDLSPITVPSARLAILNAVNSIYPFYASEPTGLAFYQKLVSTQLTNDCVDEFFANYNEPIWFLNRSRFMSTYNPTVIADWSSGGEAASIDVLVQASVCSMSIGHLLLVHQKLPYQNVVALMETYHLRAREILEDYFDILDIRVVMSLLMISTPASIVCGDRITSPREHNVYRMLAYRISERLGLFEIDRRKDVVANLNQQELENGRRIAWVILCMEFFSANNSTGTTGRIDMRHWKVNLPKGLPSETESTTKSVEYLAHFSKMIGQFKTGYVETIRYTSQVPVDISNVRSVLEHQCKKLKENASNYLELDVEKQLYSNFEHISTESTSQRSTTILGLRLHLLYYSFALSYYISFIPGKQNSYDMDLQGCQDRSVNRKNIRSNFSSNTSPNQDHNLVSSSHENIRMSPRPSNELLVSPSPLELYCTISAAVATTSIMGLLEALLHRDAMACRHDPMYWLFLITHACQLMASNSKDEDVLSLCSINITRARLHLERNPLCHMGEPRCSQLLRRLRTWQGIEPDMESMNPPVLETEILRSSAKELLYKLEHRIGPLKESNSGAWSPPRPSRQQRHTTESSEEDQQVKLEQYDERIASNEEEYNSESSYED